MAQEYVNFMREAKVEFFEENAGAGGISLRQCSHELAANSSEDDRAKYQTIQQAWLVKKAELEVLYQHLQVKYESLFSSLTLMIALVSKRILKQIIIYSSLNLRV